MATPGKERRDMGYRYGLAHRIIHWLTVLAVLAQFVLGLWMTQFEPANEDFKFLLYDIHENVGFTLLPITLLRLWLRRRNPPAALPAGTPALIHFAANANHAALYLALIGMPILGVLATTAWGFPFAWFGIVPIPSPFGKSEFWAPIFSYAHWLGAIALGLAILAHIGGALFHALIRRDGVFQRMV
jgi:cytochrome b561